LLLDFLEHKREHGAPAERALYTSMTCSELFTRLLCQRPLAFWGPGDRHVLATTLSGRQLEAQQWGGFEAIGGEKQQTPLVLENYLSYDEMQLSALISVVVPTIFINRGDRNSQCMAGQQGSFQEDGIIVACIGARMVKEQRMEAEHMLVTPLRDTADGDGCQQTDGRLLAWARFYGISHFPSHAEAAEASKQEGQGRFHRIPTKCQCCQEEHLEVWTDKGGTYCQGCMIWYNGVAPTEAPDDASYLDGLVYKRRIRATVEPFLVSASQHGTTHRAKVGCGAHVRVKALGLGCWWVTPVQEVLMKEVYSEVLQEAELPGIDVLEFAFFPSDSLPAGSQRIDVRSSKAGFAEPVDKHLLVTMYAWDGNSHPGNEWWAENGNGQYLGMSDDSAAASCSLLSSLQHPAINTERLSAKAAQVLTKEGNMRAFHVQNFGVEQSVSRCINTRMLPSDGCVIAGDTTR